MSPIVVWCCYTLLWVRDDDVSLMFKCEPPGPWIGSALCRGSDLNMFFPVAGNRPLQAIAICELCPVRVDCAEYAFDTHQHWGVWGGLTERQRFSVKKARRSGLVHPLDPVRFKKP